MIFQNAMEEYFKLLQTNYLQPEYYKKLAADWFYGGYLTKFNAVMKSMYSWMDKFYSIRFYTGSTKNNDEVNETLQEFNKAVITEIDNYRIRLEKEKSIQISFNQAAIEWIDNHYKSFKRNWFEKHCQEKFEFLFNQLT